MSSYFRITLQRSAIGLPQRTRGVLAALGLHKRSQTVFQRVSRDSAGMVLAVKELVSVVEVDRPRTTVELREERRPARGFWVVRRSRGEGGPEGSELARALVEARSGGTGAGGMGVEAGKAGALAELLGERGSGESGEVEVR